MSGVMVENIAIVAALGLLLIGGGLYVLYGVAQFIDDQRWLRARRKMSAKSDMVTIQPRINRNPDGSPPEPRK